MGAVAEGRVSRVLALTEEGIALFFRSERFRRKTGPLVRTVTEWLARRVTAGAEVIGFPRFEGDFAGSGGGNFWFGHERVVAFCQEKGK